MLQGQIADLNPIVAIFCQRRIICGDDNAMFRVLYLDIRPSDVPDAATAASRSMGLGPTSVIHLGHSDLAKDDILDTA